MSDDPRIEADLAVSIGSIATGWPCPKDETPLHIIDGPVPGAWCPKCHTVWGQIDEVMLADLDATPTPPGDET